MHRKGLVKRLVSRSYLTVASALGLLTVTVGLLAVVLPAKAAPDCSACTTPSEEELPCLEAVIVDARETLDLEVVDGTAVVTDKSLTAEYGKIVDGVYTAPNFVPPNGLDTITLFDNDGTVLAYAFVQVNPVVGMSQPGTFEAGAETSAPETLSPEDVYEEPVDPTVPVDPPATVSVSSVAPVEAVETTTVEPETQQPTDVEPLAPTPFQGGVGYAMPMRPPADVTTAPLTDLQILIVGSGPKNKGKKCGVNPKPSWVGTSCSAGAQRVVAGEWKKYLKGTPQLVTMTIAGEIIKVGGTVTLTYYKQPAVAVQFRDLYVCKNGKWTFDHSSKCVRYGSFGYGFDPGGWLVLKYLGYPSDPGYKISERMECERL